MYRTSFIILLELIHDIDEVDTTFRRYFQKPNRVINNKTCTKQVHTYIHTYKLHYIHLTSIHTMLCIPYINICSIYALTYTLLDKMYVYIHTYIYKYLDAFVLLFCVIHLNNPVLFLTFSFLIFWYCGRNRDINVSALTNFDKLSNIRFHSIMTTVGKKEVNVKCK